MRIAATGLRHNRNFVLLWCAYAVSALGDHLSEMAILKSQDALNPDVPITPLQAKMTFVFMLPFFLLGPLTGALADRLPRRWLMVTADAVRAAIMFSFAGLIALFSGAGLWRAFIPLGVVGVFAAVFSPARSSLLPTLVAREQLVRANALISGLGMIATILSAVLSGYLAQHYPVRVSFRIDGVTFVVSMLLLLGMRLPGERVLAPIERQARRWRNTLTAGFRYAATHAGVAQLIVIAMVFWFAGATVRSVVPAVVKNVYHGNFQSVGLFQMWLGLGLVSGALLISAVGDALRSEIAITWCLLGTALAVGLFTLTVFAPLPTGLAHVIGAVAVFGMGTCGAGIGAGYNALLQRIVPNRMRGRIFGVVDLCTIGGLLFATGVLAIPHWPGIDRWVGFILGAIVLLLLGTGLTTLWVRHRAAPMPFKVSFVFNLNEFLVRLVYRFRRIGPCTVPRTGPVIVVANHTSPTDPLILGAGCRYRPCAYLIAREYADYPLAGRVVRLMECIPVRRDGRDAAATKAAIRHLRAGKALGVFIEGRIAPPGEEVAPKDGVAMLALRTGATVVPAHISGTIYHQGMLRSFFLRHRARVRFGAPVDLNPFTGRRLRRGELSQATARVAAAIAHLRPDDDR